MIRFKQKEFIAPLVAIGLAGTGISAIGAKKAHDDAKVQEEELDKQNSLIRAQNKKLEKLKDELPKQKEYGLSGATFGLDLGISGISSVGEGIHKHSMKGKQSEQEDLMREQRSLLKRIKRKDQSIGESAENITKSFAIPQMGTVKGIIGAAKGAFGKEIKRNIIMGGAMGGSIYAANKYIQHDMKKNGTEVDPTTGMIQQKTYANPMPALKGLYQRIATPVGKVAKKYHLGTVGMGAAMGGVPLALGYQADKQMAQDMQEKTYGWVDGAVKTAKAMGTKQWWKAKPLFKHPGQTLSGAASNLASFGIGGTKNVQRFGNRLQTMGKIQDNQTLSKMGDWIKDNPVKANLVSIVPGAAAAKVTWDGSQKAVEKITRAVDPKSYEYQDSKNQQIQ